MIAYKPVRARRVAVRVALRELRGGLAGLRASCSPASRSASRAIAAVGSVRAAIEAGSHASLDPLLGGDAEIEFAYRFADPEERAWMEAIREAVSGTSSSVRWPDTPRAIPPLGQAPAVDDVYPLYGRRASTGGGEPFRRRWRPPTGGRAWRPKGRWPWRGSGSVGTTSRSAPGRSASLRWPRSIPEPDGGASPSPSDHRSSFARGD